ncbi:hypothetical protein UlMin_026477 [Ulmus minor]
MKNNQVQLNNGITMPIIGLGTYSYQNDKKTVESAIHMALQMGYRHFDTAKIYGSEPALGNALKEAILEGTIEREDFFVTSKLWGSDHHDPGLLECYRKLETEYLDLYLEDEFEKLELESTWVGMEKCLQMGLCRSIGVSNFSSKKLEALLDFASVPPAVNQVEMHPMWRQTKLREVCRDHKIHVSAYSPLGGPGNSWGSTAVVDNPVINSIAHQHNATPAQVALKWGLSKGSSVIVKSFNEERLKENITSLDLKLGDQDFLQIDKLEEWKIMRGEFLVNDTTSPYKTIEDLWDNEI